LAALSTSVETASGAAVVGRSVGLALDPGLRTSIATKTTTRANHTHDPNASASGMVINQPIIIRDQKVGLAYQGLRIAELAITTTFSIPARKSSVVI
jgi:hypothetical protein